MNIDHLIVDSSALIHDGPVRKIGTNFYTCEEVIGEIKDKATLQKLQTLPYELKVLQFDQDDLNTCVEFSKKTGDYHQLSAVDLKLIASTYALERRHNGYKFINKEPKPVTSCVSLQKEKTSVKFDDQDDDWITPDNIEEVFDKMGIEKRASVTITNSDLDDRVTVACMTSDFSIQNCLLQMGLLVVSPIDGLMIKEAKKIVLRCHACFKVFHDPSKVKNKFCPHCGNLDTLKRVHYVIDQDGTKRVLINYKRPIKVKGTNQQLPRPRGGKHANNPILTADQKVHQVRAPKRETRIDRPMPWLM